MAKNKRTRTRRPRWAVCGDSMRCLKGSHSRLDCANLRAQAFTRLKRGVAA